MQTRTTVGIRFGLVILLLTSIPTWADDLPQGAAGVIEQLNQDVAQIERQADAQIADVMRRVYAIEDQTAEEARELTIAAIDELKAMQEEFTREGKLDEALVIRETVRAMEVELDGVEISEFDGYIDYNTEVGTVFYFRLTGDADIGSVWGSGIYTYDSNLAVAAVHSGAIQDGESGIVRVTILPGQESYTGSERHGVESYDYGNYGLSYRIEPAGPVVRAQARRAERNPGNAPNAETPANEEQ